MKVRRTSSSRRLLAVLGVSSVATLVLAASMGVPESHSQSQGGCGGDGSDVENIGTSNQAITPLDQSGAPTTVSDRVVDPLALPPVVLPIPGQPELFLVSAPVAAATDAAPVVPAQCTASEIAAEVASVKAYVQARAQKPIKGVGGGWAGDCNTTFCVGADNNCAGLGIGAIQNAVNNGPCGTVNPCVMFKLREVTPGWPCLQFQQAVRTKGSDHQVTVIVGPDGVPIGYIDAWACTGGKATVAMVGDACWNTWFGAMPDVSPTSPFWRDAGDGPAVLVGNFGGEGQPCFANRGCNNGLMCRDDNRTCQKDACDSPASRCPQENGTTIEECWPPAATPQPRSARYWRSRSCPVIRSEDEPPYQTTCRTTKYGIGSQGDCK